MMGLLKEILIKYMVSFGVAVLLQSKDPQIMGVLSLAIIKVLIPVIMLSLVFITWNNHGI